MDIIRATSKLSAVRVANSVISFFALAYFARSLGAEQMGIYFLFYSLMAALTIPADFGIRGAVQKRISEGESPSVFLTTGAILKLLPLSIVALAIFLFSGRINSYIGAEFVILLIIALFLEEYSTLVLNVLNGELEVGKTAVLRLSKQVTWAVVGTMLISIDFEAQGLVLALMSGQSVMIIIGVYRWSTPVGRPAVTKARSLWEFSRYNVLTSIGSFVHNWLDILLLGFFLGQAAVGAYEIAWRVATILLLVTKSFATTVIPQVSSWHASGNQSRIESFAPTGILISVVFVIPGAFGAFLLSEEILGLIFGQEYTVAALALVILVAGKCIEAVHIFLGRMLAGIDRPDVGARIDVLMVLLNILLNSILIPLIGIPGAAIGTVVSFSLGTVILSYLLSNLIRLRLPIRGMLYVLAASLGMGLVVYFARSSLIIDSLIELFAVVALGCAVYFTLVYAITPLRTQLVRGIRELP